MKKHILFILCISGLNNPIVSQEIPCQEKGITTNPDYPVNEHHPNYSNTFDWRTNFFNGYYFNSMNPNIPNPYITNQGGVQSLYGTDDYKTEDGWELLYVDLGLDKFGEIAPYRSGNLVIVLYNKFRSIVRVFVAITQISPSNLLEIKFQISEESPYYTAIFSPADKVMKPLKLFNRYNSYSNSQNFINLHPIHGFTHWYYADFYVGYDPCSCMPVNGLQIPSILKLKFELIETATINLSGVSVGNITMLNKHPNSSSGTAMWGKFFGNVKRLQSGLEAGNKTFKTFSNFSSDVKTIANASTEASKIKSGMDQFANYLTGTFPVLKYVPYVGEALAIIDFFVGGGKKNGETELRFPPLAMELSHSFSGNITNSFIFGTSTFFMPGTVSIEPTPPTGQTYDHRYPLYNEILGVYTLLDRPIVELFHGPVEINHYSNGRIEGTWRHLFKIKKESIKLAFNPASKLEIKDIYFQLKVKIDQNFNLLNYSKGTVIDNYWISDIFSYNCIDDFPLFIDFYSEFTPSDLTEIELKTIVELSKDNSRYVHMHSWDLQIKSFMVENSPDEVIHIPMNNNPLYLYKYFWFDKEPFTDRDYSFYLNNQDSLTILNQTVAQTLKSVESIKIENSILTSDEIDVKAGKFIDILPTSEIYENTNFIIYRPGLVCSGNHFEPANQEQIMVVCNSQEYRNSRTKKLLSPESIDSNEYNKKHLAELLIYPNPVQSFFHIELLYPRNSITKVLIYDLKGKLIHTDIISENEFSKSINVYGISTGIYLLRLENQHHIHTEKLIINN